jgi:integrase
MPHANLTESFCKRLLREVKDLPVGAPIDYFSSSTSKLSLRALGPSEQHRNGLLSWRFTFRFEGRQLVMTFGHYPTWSSAEAHAKARKAQVLLDEKQNPQTVMFPRSESLTAETAVAVDTVASTVADYERFLMSKSKTYYANSMGILRRHVLPQWGERDVRSITRREIVAAGDDIAAAGHAVASNHFLTTVNSWLIYTAGRDKIAASPASRIPRLTEKSRERAPSDAELVGIWLGADRLGYPAGAFIKMLMTTVARRSEVAGMRWDDVDDDAWNLPAEATKSRRAHVVPLSPLAREVLNSCPRVGTFVFSSSAGRRPLAGFASIKRRLDARITEMREAQGLPPVVAWTLHDIRRGSSTSLGKLGIDNFIVGKLLNHGDSSVTGIYNRYSHIKEKTAALNLWSKHLKSLISEQCEEPEALAAE